MSTDDLDDDYCSEFVTDDSNDPDPNNDLCLLFRYDDELAESNCPFYLTDYCKNECPWAEQ